MSTTGDAIDSVTLINVTGETATVSVDCSFSWQTETAPPGVVMVTVMKGIPVTLQP